MFKLLVYGGIILGGLLGGYIPVLLGADAFSFTSIILSAAGSLLGLWIGYKIFKIFFD